MSYQRNPVIDSSMISLTTVQTPTKRKALPLPIISITDHLMTEYTHNIVVRYTAYTHHVDYCTYLDDLSDISEVMDHLYSTLTVLGTDTAEYSFNSIRWTDDN
jgi:hypothetical protein